MASAYHLMSQQGRLTLVVHTEKLKPMIKGTISGRMLSSGTSHVAFASVLLDENPTEEVLDYDNRRGKRATL